MKRNIVSVALLGVADSQSRALMAATAVIASRLPADLRWEHDAAQAAIIILNTGDAEGEDLGTRFAAENDAVLVPYRDSGECPAHGISRPLRMGHLQEILGTAVRRALEHSPPSNEAIARRSYRGQTQDCETKTGSGSGAYARVYRGRAV